MSATWWLRSSRGSRGLSVTWRGRSLRAGALAGWCPCGLVPFAGWCLRSDLFDIRCVAAGSPPRRAGNFLLLAQKKVTAVSKTKCNEGLNFDALFEAVLEENF